MASLGTAIGGTDHHLAVALTRWVRGAIPALLFGIRLWVAVCLALFVAFELELENPSWAGTSAALVCQPILGASLRKGWFRMIGTVIGATAAVVLSACFPQSRIGFLLGLAVWGGLCASAATLLHNFAAYAAALAGFTAAIIAGNELGSVGGANGLAFQFALSRGAEICIGIVCAGLVLALSDLGGSRRRLALLLGAITNDATNGLVHALRLTRTEQTDARMARRQLLVRVTGLDTVIDQAMGEIATLPFHPRALQAAVDGLFAAILAWRSIANHLDAEPDASADAAQVLDCLPAMMAVQHAAVGEPSRQAGDPLATRAAMMMSVRRLMALPAPTPSLRRLCDRTAEGLLGLCRALTGVLALTQPRLALMPRHVGRLRVSDALPALVSGVRAFLTIAAAGLVWIATAWPSGATFIVFATIGITMFAPLGTAAYAAARSFTVGTAVAAVGAAVAVFALLPQQPTFLGFCGILGLWLVPVGALVAQPWQQGFFFALQANFVPLLNPTNPMTYDQVKFYNLALAILGGIALAMLALRLLPPVSMALRDRRLLALTLRDLRRLARGKSPVTVAEWDQRNFGRLSAMQGEADLLPAAQLAAGLSLGGEMIRLRRIAHRFALAAEFDRAMAAIANGDSAMAIRQLEGLDQALADTPLTGTSARYRLRAQGLIRSIAYSLTQFPSYFDAKTA
jgi:uncharacterized membrane protein YccC